MNPPDCWNHRLVVVKKEQDNITYYQLVIREVYYNQAGVPFASGDADLHMVIAPYEPEDPVEEFKTELECMLKAFDKPILDEDLKEVDRERAVLMLRSRKL